ncbi:hypothetical protein ACQEVM_37530 [Streptomyces sp. CA-243310]|uniref:hypothetical protein n=1 Tax=Streptomyces sp. CA-243310 TaxID=3240056 RepID=UPI003D94B512
MKPSELPDLHAHLRDALSTTSGMSIALSGSLARGDYRTNPEGAITSDLDLIPVVRRATDVASARTQLEPILRETADRFQIVATAAVTLLTAFLDAPHARYVTSMPADPWITDPLDVATHTPATSRPPASRSVCPG